MYSSKKIIIILALYKKTKERRFNLLILCLILISKTIINSK